MRNLKNRLTSIVLGGGATTAALLMAGSAQAQVSSETAFVFNTFSFLICGALVMWMAAGFAMLEAGMVRGKNVATICLKNIVIYSIAGIMFYLIGYSLMYSGVSENTGWIGTLKLLYNSSPAELAVIDGGDATAYVGEASYSIMSDWFFQMVFVATAASIVSGTLAERIKFWPFMIFVTILTGVLYPIQGAWSWGTGWLNGVGEGFSDFAGSSIVHAFGAGAALAGALVVGARKGKYGKDGQITPMPASNLPLVTLGTFILWMGWFGFNGGSVLALGSAASASSMAIVFANTNLAAAGGVVAATLLSQILFKKIDLTLVLNGALAGLVSITAGPDISNSLFAIIIGAIGAVLATLSVLALDKLKIDDVVGAISVHGTAGIWGTLAVGIFGGGDFIAQLTGTLAIVLFSFVTSLAIFLLLKVTMGVRISEEDERRGQDAAELGMEAYPEFGVGSGRR